jgi:hypothetical protein
VLNAHDHQKHAAGAHRAQLQRLQQQAQPRRASSASRAPHGLESIAAGVGHGTADLTPMDNLEGAEVSPLSGEHAAEHRSVLVT